MSTTPADEFPDFRPWDNEESNQRAAGKLIEHVLAWSPSSHGDDSDGCDERLCAGNYNDTGKAPPLYVPASELLMSRFSSHRPAPAGAVKCG